jgi:predicted transcriptional regulator
MPEADIAALDDVRRRRRISRSAVIREAARDYLARHIQPDPDVEFGAWDAAVGDGLDYQTRLRPEW